MSDAARPSTFNVPAVDENGATRDTPIAGEHPLTLYVDKREILTLMTLGAAPEALAIGYLRNQRLLDRIEDIVSVQVDWDVNAVVINTRSGLKDLEAKLGKRTTTSGCGQGTVFGDLMEEIDSVRLPADATLDAQPRSTRCSTACACTRRSTSRPAPCTAARSRPTARVKARSSTSSRTSAGTTRSMRSPGGCGSTGSTAATRFSTRPGRLTSEMVIKAAQMGIPFLVSRSGLTQMGYEIAQKVGITMIGRATNKHFLLFTGGERFRA